MILDAGLHVVFERAWQKVGGSNPAEDIYFHYEFFAPSQPGEARTVSE